MGQIQYSEKYFDDIYEYRHVVLPSEVTKLLPKNRLLSEVRAPAAASTGESPIRLKLICSSSSLHDRQLISFYMYEHDSITKPFINLMHVSHFLPLSLLSSAPSTARPPSSPPPSEGSPMLQSEATRSRCVHSIRRKRPGSMEISASSSQLELQIDGDNKWLAAEEMRWPRNQSLEEQMFLQMVVAFGLSEKFETEFLRKLILEHAWRKEMAKLAVGLGFGVKMPDIINELVSMGKGIEAVYFAHESGLIEQFPPIPLIESHLQSSKKIAQNILKNGKHSPDAVDESCNVESGALRSIIKCVETLKLEPNFSLYSVRRRLSELEREKADRRKSAAGNRMNKRQRSIGFGTNFHPAKAARSGDTSYAPFHRNSPTVRQIPSIRHTYNPASSSLGAIHTQSPVVIPRQYYATEDIPGARASLPYAGPSASYSGYDYAVPRTALAQTTYPPH